MRNGRRCIGPNAKHQLQQCERVIDLDRVNGLKGWDFVGLHPIVGWVCPTCRERFRGVFARDSFEKKVKAVIGLSVKRDRRHRKS